MDQDEFWAIIEASKNAAEDFYERPAALRDILVAKEPNELVEFYECYIDQIESAYRWDLWGAAYLINGGCSDDGFDYFRDWLISEGREVFEAALADPESLAALEQLEETELEEMRYVADEVYEKKTGAAMQPRQREYKEEPAGEAWDEDALYSLYPKLASIYG